MFENYKTFSYELAGRPLVIETGKLAQLAGGSCLVPSITKKGFTPPERSPEAGTAAKAGRPNTRYSLPALSTGLSARSSRRISATMS